MLFESWLSLDYRRRRLLARTAPGPLHDYLSVPFPSRRADCRATSFVAMDLETTGLNAQCDEILSIGIVTVDALQIQLDTACHYFIRPHQEIPEASAVIHRITDDLAQQGESLADIIALLLHQLAGKVMVAHHARFELNFINTACLGLFGQGFLIPVVDTMSLEQRRRQRANRVYRAKELRLDALRQAYNLPRYRAHNALSDALAAAELFIAQIAQIENRKPLPLGDYLMRY